MDLVNIDEELEVSLKIEDDTPAPVIKFTAEAYLKMRQLVMSEDKEVGWHGLVRKEDNVYTIYDVLVYPQTVTGATVQTDTEKYTGWFIEQDIEHMRFQGHSHVNMSTSPSGVDVQYYSDLISSMNDYYIFFIMNKRGEYHLEFHDLVNGISYDKLSYDIVLEDKDLNEWYHNNKELIEEYKPKVTEYKSWDYSKKKKKRGEIRIDDDDIDYYRQMYLEGGWDEF